ncbi:MAG: hypothetical protein BGO98_09860 [Myxococcales bacterium 68-20]|nr:MAG: hypothetical protein BGO98_09860 [Myxococcales bacterium 68-20]
MSLEPEKKPSLLAPLADQYELTKEGADRILSKIQTAYSQDAGTTSPVSATARSGTGKLSLLLGSTCAALALVGVSIHLSSGVEAPPVIAPSAVASPMAVVPPSEAAQETEPVVAVPSVSVDSLPSVAEIPPSTRAPSKKSSAAITAGDAPATAPAGASSDTLQQEARLITDARLALEHGDGDKALARLAEHARLFPNGWFAADRAAERIVVLCSLGRRAEAEKEATVFLQSRPKSPLTRRVEASCAGDSITKAAK